MCAWTRSTSCGDLGDRCGGRDAAQAHSATAPARESACHMRRGQLCLTRVIGLGCVARSAPQPKAALPFQVARLCRSQRRCSSFKLPGFAAAKGAVPLSSCPALPRPKALLLFQVARLCRGPRRCSSFKLPGCAAAQGAAPLSSCAALPRRKALHLFQVAQLCRGARRCSSFKLRGFAAAQGAAPLSSCAALPRRKALLLFQVARLCRAGSHPAACAARLAQPNDPAHQMGPICWTRR